MTLVIDIEKIYTHMKKIIGSEKKSSVFGQVVKTVSQVSKMILDWFKIDFRYIDWVSQVRPEVIFRPKNPNQKAFLIGVTSLKNVTKAVYHFLTQSKLCRLGGLKSVK